MKTPAKNITSKQLASNINRTMNNRFNITVQAAPQQDTRQIADEVMRRFEEQSRGALFDITGATP